MKHNLPDLIDLKIAPRAKITEGFCRLPKKNGQACGNRIAALCVCVSHLKLLGGHIWLADNHEPNWWLKKRERYSFCRACGTVKDKVSVKELCPIRQNCPDAPCSTSPDLPSRLQYRFAKTEYDIFIQIQGQEKKIDSHGPFAAYCLKPGINGCDWCVFHLPSGFPVAWLDSETSSIALMKKICHEGTELDFIDPMKMDDGARFCIDLAVRYFRRGECIRAPGGILTRTAKRPYFERVWLYYEENFEGKPEERHAKVECWGPFGFEPFGSGKIALHNLESYSSVPIFEAPSKPRAIAFSKAAAQMDLDWHDSRSNYEPRYQEKTKAGVGRLLAEFKDIACLDEGLLPLPQAKRITFTLVFE